MSFSRRAYPILAIALIAAAPALAQQATEEAHTLFGGDAYHAGQTILHDQPGADDLFAAGQRIRVAAPVTGSVHAAGQSIGLEAAVGGDVYAVGQEITVAGDVAGDVSAAGQDISLRGSVGRNVRAAGASVEVGGPVGGSAALAGTEVRIEAPVAGDVSLAAERVVFGDGARIDGTLTLYEEVTGTTEVPERVIGGDRVTRRQIEEWDEDSLRRQLTPDWRSIVGRFVGGVVLVAALAALVAALMPERLAEMRRRTLAAPFRTLGVGFIAQSAIIGSIVVMAVTVIGLLLVPGILLATGVSALAGYVVGAYAFGVGLVLLIGRDEPDTLAERALAAGVGALVAGLLGLVPFLGWLFVIALSLTGIGAIVRGVLDRGASA